MHDLRIFQPDARRELAAATNASNPKSSSKQIEAFRYGDARRQRAGLFERVRRQQHLHKRTTKRADIGDKAEQGRGKLEQRRTEVPLAAARLTMRH